MRFGIYYYPWYHAARWRQHDRLLTPAIGEYDSSSPLLIEHHIKQLAWLGVDYVVLEMLPVNDWDFERTFAATVNLVEGLRAKGIGYTFLIDTAVGTGHEDSFALLDVLLSRMDAAKLHPTVEKDGKTLYFFFSTTVPLADRIIKRFSDWSVFFPIFIADWSVSDTNAVLFLQKNGLMVDETAPRNKSLPLINYITFWCGTEQIFSSQGFASVIPGYDDLLLQRNPQLAPLIQRHEGATLVNQFQRAVESGADDILIYGWNEYFETTVIEPTLEYGDFFSRLAKELIHQAKDGQPIHLPEGIGKPEPSSPLYLAKDLERSGQCHTDGIPRWDQDDYLAEVVLSPPHVGPNQHLLFEKIRVTNRGRHVWSASEPIRLGVRLFDGQEEALREGRADFGNRHIQPGQSVAIDLTLEATGLPAGYYTLRVGVVWDGHFWLPSETTMSIHL